MQKEAFYFDSRTFRANLAWKQIRSIAKLAEHVELSEQYVRQIAGGFIPPVETRERIARVLGVPAKEIWRVIYVPTNGVW